MAGAAREGQAPTLPPPERGPDAPPQVMPAVVGILVIGLAVLVIGFWVDARRNSAQGAAEPAALPQITLVEPTPGATVASPVALVFELPERLRWVGGGWQVGRHHIHAMIDDAELMPASRDVEPLGQNRYRWVLPALQPGEYALRLFWSGPDHRAIEEGESETIRVRVR